MSSGGTWSQIKQGPVELNLVYFYLYTSAKLA
jgi:hypothetical protein